MWMLIKQQQQKQQLESADSTSTRTKVSAVVFSQLSIVTYLNDYFEELSIRNNFKSY